LGLLALLMTACSPVEQDVHPSTHDAEIHENRLVLGDDVPLPLHQWMPDSTPKAIIVAVHGFNDYSNAFTGPAAFFNQHGIGVIAYDQRGFGKGPERGIWAGEYNLTHDLRQVVSAVRRHYPGTPVYVMGESMGGAVAIVALSQPDFPKTDGLILVAPALWGDKSMNGFFRGMLWFLAHTMPSQTIQSTGDQFRILASDNIAILRAMGMDPLIIKKTRIDAVYGMLHLMDSAYKNVNRLRVPVLLLYGAHDQVIPPQPVKDALLRLQTPYTFAYYPKGYHMLMRDLEANLVLVDTLAWIKSPGAALPSGADRRWKQRQEKAARTPMSVIAGH
jgi:alpha-beta hydrolase superfamily lysophospholipase